MHIFCFSNWTQIYNIIFVLIIENNTCKKINVSCFTKNLNGI